MVAAFARQVLTASDRYFLGTISLCGFAALGAWLLAATADVGLVNLEEVTPEPPPYVLPVNSATWPELAQLPGIGEVLAKRVVQHRHTVGSFASLDGLQAVSGIGPAKAERIAPFLSLPANSENRDR